MCSSDLLILGGEEPTLRVTVGFQPSGLEGLSGTPDIDIESLTLYLDVTFDGLMTASCDAGASTVLGIDESDKVASAMAAQVTAQLQAPDTDFSKYSDPTAVKANLETFFARLMHLPAGAKVKTFRFDGPSLVVDYYPPPKVVSPGLLHRLQDVAVAEAH